uniref:Uncharacterized protein n=1 Tax=Heterosigma akashiwo TaxID=2829 RepID=A0A6V1Q839_HETAK
MGNRDVQQRSIPLRFDRNEEPMELQKGEDIRALVTPSTGLPVMPSQHSQDHKKMAALFTENRVERIDKETPNSTSQNSIWGGGLSASCTTIDGLDLEDGDFLSEGDLNPSGESNDDEYNLPQQQQKRGLETGVSSPMKEISKRRRNNINIGAVEVRSKKNTEELVSTGEDCSACDDDDDDTNNHGPKIGDELMGHDKELCSTASNSSTTTKKQSQQLSSIFSKEATSGGNLSSVLDAMIFSQDDSDDAFC